MTIRTTGRLEYQRITEIDYSRLEFDPDEPDPMPDAMEQDLIFQVFMHVLSDWVTDLGENPDNFLSSNTILCYDRRNLNIRVQPDCYLALGVDAEAIRKRKMYLPWEVGKPPDFALEVASQTTSRQDVEVKNGIYARIGVREYWRFDATGGEYYGQPLAGDRLVDGAYQPIELTREPDGVLKGYSAVLDLYLCWDKELLHFYDPASQTYLRTISEERAARRAAESDRQSMQAERDAAQGELRAERAARIEAELQAREARAARIDAEIREQAEQAARIDAEIREQAEQAARIDAEIRARELEERLRRLEEERGRRQESGQDPDAPDDDGSGNGDNNNGR